MDNLPKSNNQDWTSISGKYPDEPTGQGGNPPPVVPNPLAPPATEQSLSTSDPFSQATVANLTPNLNQTSDSSTQPIMSTIIEPNPQNVDKTSTSSATSDLPTPGLQSQSVASENPFTTEPPNPPPKTKKSSGMTRRLITLVILLGMVLMGFVGFKALGGLLAKRGPITLTYWGLWENEDVFTQIIQEYKKTHPNVEVVYSKQNPKQYRERLQSAIERGDGPDIFRFHNTWVPMLKNELAVSGKTGYSTSEFQDTFYPVAVSDLVISGKVYGVPLMIDGLGLYYNDDLLRAAGVVVPTTWEEFRNAALQLTVKDEAGQIITAGAALGNAVNIEHFSDILALMILQNGADLKNPTTVEAHDALAFYRLFSEPPNNVWDETQDNSILAFAGGKVAMIFAPSWQAFTIHEINPDLKFQIIPVPQLSGTSTTWASYWAEGVSSKSQHTDDAWAFIKFLSSKENMISLYTEASKTRLFGEPYSRMDMAQNVISDPYVGAYVQQAPTAKSFFLASRTHDNGINDRMIQYLTDAVNSLGKGQSQQAALETTAQGFAQVLSSFGFSALPSPQQ